MTRTRPTSDDLPPPAEPAARIALRAGLVMGLFWLAVYLLYTYQETFHSFLTTLLVMDSEYTVPEQLSK